jgi:addiction module RelE/StbE family toxin
MDYRLIIKPRAEKELKKINKKDYYRILSAFTILCGDPFLGKKMKGDFDGSYTYRLWPYRIIYQIHKKELIIAVVRVAQREGVYRSIFI